MTINEAVSVRIQVPGESVSDCSRVSSFWSAGACN